MECCSGGMGAPVPASVCLSGEFVRNLFSWQSACSWLIPRNVRDGKDAKPTPEGNQRVQGPCCWQPDPLAWESPGHGPTFCSWLELWLTQQPRGSSSAAQESQADRRDKHTTAESIVLHMQILRLNALKGCLKCCCCP